MTYHEATAIKLLGHSPQGQTIPLYLMCRTGTGDAPFQCKLSAVRTGLHPIELATEFVGNVSARRLGLRSVEPYLIHLPDATIVDVERRYRFQVQSSLAVGMPWSARLTPFIPRIHRERIPDSVAAKLLALDIILANGDRTDLNPNLAFLGDDLFVFDFEHCLELPGSAPEEILKGHAALVPNLVASHVLGSRLSGVRAEVLSSLATAHQWLGAKVPAPWEEDFRIRSRYLEYLEAEPGALMDVVGAMKP